MSSEEQYVQAQIIFKKNSCTNQNTRVDIHPTSDVERLLNKVIRKYNKIKQSIMCINGTSLLFDLNNSSL